MSELSSQVSSMPEEMTSMLGSLEDRIIQEFRVINESFGDGAVIYGFNNYFYVATEEISTLTISNTSDRSFSVYFTLAAEGDITITLPECKYIGGVPSFANGETWELNFRNNVVVGGKVE